MKYNIVVNKKEWMKIDFLIIHLSRFLWSLLYIQIRNDLICFLISILSNITRNRLIIYLILYKKFKVEQVFRRSIYKSIKNNHKQTEHSLLVTTKVSFLITILSKYNSSIPFPRLVFLKKVLIAYTSAVNLLFMKWCNLLC